MIEFLNSKNLLFLEDNEDFIGNVITLFQMYVNTCFIAKTTKKAFEILKKEKIDFIISDIHLQNENGLDFIKKFREIDKDMPIIVLSGDKDEDLLFKAIPLNLVGYLLKPINFKSLMSIFEDCSKRLIQLQDNIIEFKDGFFYDKNLKIIKQNETIYELNKKEILFFDLISQNKHIVITKDMIATYVYLDEEMSDSALNNFILRIRKKFGKNFLYTIPDLGYKLIL